MKKILVLCFVVLLIVFSPSPTHAAWAPQCTFTGTDVASLRGIECIIGIFLNIATALAGIAFLIMILANGFKLLGAWGNPKSVEEAQKGLTMAFLGLFLLIAAWLIIRFLENFTGLKLTTFSLQILPP
jgi:hypothetical protein